MITPDDFLKLAQTLANIPNPACLRTAIGRAYYAVFNEGKQCQAKWQLALFGHGGDHNLVIQRFVHSGDNDLSIAGQKMRDLKSWRSDADYNLKASRVENQAKVANKVEAAVRVMTLIKAAPHPLPPTVLANIQVWENDNPDDTP